MSGTDAPDTETMNRKVAKMVEEALKYTKVESVLDVEKRKIYLVRNILRNCLM